MNSFVELVIPEELVEEGIPIKSPYVLESFIYLKGNGVQIQMTTPHDRRQADMAPFLKYGDEEFGVIAMVSNPNKPLSGLSDYWKFEERGLSNAAISKQQVLAFLLPLRNFIFSEYMQTGSENMMLDDYVQAIKELSNILGESYSFFGMNISDVESSFVTVCIIILKKMDQSVLSKELKRHSALLALAERFMGAHLKAVEGALDLSKSLDGVAANQFVGFLRNECTTIDPRNQVYLCNFRPNNEHGVPDGVAIVKTFRGRDICSTQYWNEMVYLKNFKPYGIVPELIAFASNTHVQFVMTKYYPDGDLVSKVEDTHLTWIEAIKILKRVAYLIYAIHSFLEPDKLVYCDFKPENFLLNGDDILICDMASVCFEGEYIHTRSKPYLEDLRERNMDRDPYPRGDRDAHPRGDIYKIGKFIIKLVTRIAIEDPVTKNMVPKLGEVVSSCFSTQSLNDIMRLNMIESGCGETRMKDIINLALRCLDPYLERRPTANKLADELAAIEEKIVNQKITSSLV